MQSQTESNKESNLSAVAKTVHKVLTPFYVELRKTDQKGESIKDIINKMSSYGTRLAKDLPEDERKFFEDKLRPLVLEAADKLIALRANIQTKKDNQEIDQTDENVTINFVTGLKKETSKAREFLA